MDEHDLAKRLMSYDTSTPEGITTGVSFIKGWLESNGFEIEEMEVAGLPVIITSTKGTGPTLVAATEGAVVMSRAERTLEPFELVAAEMGRVCRSLVEAP